MRLQRCSVIGQHEIDFYPVGLKAVVRLYVQLFLAKKAYISNYLAQIKADDSISWRKYWMAIVNTAKISSVVDMGHI